VYSEGTITVPKGSPIRLDAGGALTLAGQQVQLDSAITIPSGSVLLEALPTFATTVGSTIGVHLGADASVDVSGEWVNEGPTVSAQTQAGPNQPLWLNGGSISVVSLQGSLLLDTGSSLSANGGALRSSTGAVTAGNGGAIKLRSVGAAGRPARQLAPLLTHAPAAARTVVLWVFGLCVLHKLKEWLAQALSHRARGQLGVQLGLIAARVQMPKAASLHVPCAAQLACRDVDAQKEPTLKAGPALSVAEQPFCQLALADGSAPCAVVPAAGRAPSDMRAVAEHWCHRERPPAATPGLPGRPLGGSCFAGRRRQHRCSVIGGRLRQHRCSVIGGGWCDIGAGRWRRRAAAGGGG